MPALYIVLDREQEDLDVQVNGKALSANDELLGEFARDLSLTPLMAFFSMDPVTAAEFVDDAGGDSSFMTFPDEEWFEPSLGLTTVRGLSNSSVPDAEHVLSDLTDFERVLLGAEAYGLRWHLAVDF